MIPFKTTDEQILNIASIMTEMRRAGVEGELIVKASDLARTDQGIYDLMELWLESPEKNEIIADIKELISDYGKIINNKAGNNNGKHVRIYGLFRSSLGNIGIFNLPDESPLPEGCIEGIREIISGYDAEVKVREMQKLAKEYESPGRLYRRGSEFNLKKLFQNKNNEYIIDDEIVAGRVATYFDKLSEHHSIILKVMNDKCFALFFTSNPNWGKQTRRARKEELAAAGYVKNKQTYISSVIRPTNLFNPTDLTIPNLLLSELQEEFKIENNRYV